MRAPLGFVAVIGTLLVSAPAFSQSGVTSDLASQPAKAAHVRELVAAWQADPKRACDSTSISTAFYEATAMQIIAIRSGLSREVPGMLELPLESSLEVADALLAEGCLDEADRIYRSALQVSENPALGRIRQRALLGVDDVRATRVARVNRPERR